MVLSKLAEASVRPSGENATEKTPSVWPVSVRSIWPLAMSQSLTDLPMLSHARFIRAYCPVLEFGLVGATSHMVDEHASEADLEALTEIYAAILEDYFR